MLESFTYEQSIQQHVEKTATSMRTSTGNHG